MARKATRQAARRRVQGARSEVPQEPVIETPAAAPEETPPDIPGMKSETWSGIPMFRCEKCGATTFKREEAEGHVCKTVKYASEGDDT